jgi:hypothetical protein
MSVRTYILSGVEGSGTIPVMNPPATILTFLQRYPEEDWVGDNWAAELNVKVPRTKAATIKDRRDFI